jgi:serine/threonine-protein kinase
MMEQNGSPTPILNKRYKLIKKLGSGGMSVVYEAQDLMLERLVAIKILRQDYSTDMAFRERFRSEARAAANLSHPNIVTVHDFGLDTGRLFIVMEQVPGTDLKSLIKTKGRLAVKETIDLITQAANGLGYAHRAGIVHCDVKPQNLLVTPDQRVKITDFGIARALSTITPDEQNDLIWGSPLYFSPEQAAGLAPSPASDVYSLGIIMYEMLTGSLPFIAESAQELIRLHLDVEPVSPSKLNPAISDELDQIVCKLLSKEPSARYRTADQLSRILSTYLDNQNRFSANGLLNQQVAAPPQPPPFLTEKASAEPLAKANSPLDWLTVGLGLLATLAVGGLIPFWIYVILKLTTK